MGALVRNMDCQRCGETEGTEVVKYEWLWGEIKREPLCAECRAHLEREPSDDEMNNADSGPSSLSQQMDEARRIK